MFKYVALYVRTSTLQQTTGLEAQILALKKYCELNAIMNFKVFSDEGVSGSKCKRPGLDHLMISIASGEIEAVVVYSFSRFARSVRHLLDALEFFERAGISFVSVSENLDTRTSTGRFVFTILAALASMERDILIDRVKTGLLNARHKGRKLGRPRTRPAQLIWELRRNGYNFRQIADLAKCSVSTVFAELNSPLPADVNKN